MLYTRAWKRVKSSFWMRPRSVVGRFDGTRPASRRWLLVAGRTTLYSPKPIRPTVLSAPPLPRVASTPWPEAVNSPVSAEMVT